MSAIALMPAAKDGDRLTLDMLGGTQGNLVCPTKPIMARVLGIGA